MEGRQLGAVSTVLLKSNIILFSKLNSWDHLLLYNQTDSTWIVVLLHPLGQICPSPSSFEHLEGFSSHLWIKTFYSLKVPEEVYVAEWWRLRLMIWWTQQKRSSLLSSVLLSTNVLLFDAHSNTIAGGGDIMSWLHRWSQCSEQKLWFHHMKHTVCHFSDPN